MYVRVGPAHVACWGQRGRLTVLGSIPSSAQVRGAGAHMLAVLPPLEGTPTVRSPPSSAKRGAPRGARWATDFPIYWWAVFIPAGGGLGESGPEPVTS